jgi:hypothetical protein
MTQTVEQAKIIAQLARALQKIANLPVAEGNDVGARARRIAVSALKRTAA